MKSEPADDACDEVVVAVAVAVVPVAVVACTSSRLCFCVPGCARLEKTKMLGMPEVRGSYALQYCLHGQAYEKLVVNTRLLLGPKL